MPHKRDSDASPGQKLIGLFALLLFSGRSYSLSELSERFRCSKQTVARMIEEIERSHGAEVLRTKEGRERFFQVAAPRQRPRAALTPEQLGQLVLCRDLVTRILPRDMRESLDDALLKTTALLPDFDGRSAAFQPLAQVAVKGMIDYSPFQDILAKLIDSMRSKSVCEVKYQSLAGNGPRTHHFAPFRLLAHREALYALGWKVNGRGAVETIGPMMLAVHRIRGAEWTRRDFGHLPEPEMPDPGAFGIVQGEPFRVRVRFDAQVAQYVRERIWSADQAIEELEGGGVELEFTANNEEEVVSWVLSFGGHAEVAEPHRLIERYSEVVSYISKRRH
jgi:predicted DNA-binding transcriptional regulator YafY